MNDFFQVLKSIMPESDITYKMVVSRKLETLSVTVIPTVKEGKEFDLPAFTCKGTAEELDEKFMTAFAAVVNKNKEFITNAIDFDAQMAALAEKKKDELAKKPTTKKEATAKNATLKDDDDVEDEQTNGETKGIEKPVKASKPQKISKDLKTILDACEKYETASNWDLAVYSYSNLLKKAKLDPESNSELIEKVRAKLAEIGSKSSTYTPKDLSTSAEISNATPQGTQSDLMNQAPVESEVPPVVVESATVVIPAPATPPAHSAPLPQHASTAQVVLEKPPLAPLSNIAPAPAVTVKEDDGLF